jgi:tetratricopeptide (TPR) repeat protein
MSLSRTLVSKACLWSCVLLIGVQSSGFALADAGVEKLRETGMAAYQAGDYASAKKAFDDAYSRSPLSSLGVWSARARVKLGELVEADERYDRLLKAAPRRGEPSEDQARNQAAKEREELRHRIPRLRIRVEGVQAADVAVSIDGVAVGEEFLLAKKAGPFPHGKSLEVNPGDHRIMGVSGDQSRELSVSLSEGQTRDVNLRFANPDTIRQRKCSDRCRSDCGDSNKCYVECKHRCFTDKTAK